MLKAYALISFTFSVRKGSIVIQTHVDPFIPGGPFGHLS